MEHSPARNRSKRGTCEAKRSALVCRSLASSCSKRGTCEAGELASAGGHHIKAATEVEKLI